MRRLIKTENFFPSSKMILNFQKGELVKPNYNSVDLAEVELAASAAQMVYYDYYRPRTEYEGR